MVSVETRMKSTFKNILCKLYGLPIAAVTNCHSVMDYNSVYSFSRVSKSETSFRGLQVLAEPVLSGLSCSGEYLNPYLFTV